ncbi:MAG: 4-hydroxy-3-methylbut-2-enyl diphosphate reductase [Bacteroidetes bacterium GWC2_33_15]|nr:MAG: 4-hydroxy-3-methylbut-2-enyl diphosphate reductase [Bacteroidetes bacterium GWA2_33_15]OFX51862.1 MAG: 4-hydroxy-3-methylbut-2-enyl diphosphate reductase [Bacteroidetes bacterium GWC2_33_15]OFX63430.1 MAG: 4-hydroxy-3-methylbut-2-enyl diphosphate reductase [Bacteroidetes bacterium GWB2_32_14]OFX67222.1 MAG: 4-hydroxy-3-methylbut-2-enyl diphosphate reductase [Bacteroidetes bacterium GWD2_33_33]HAN17051.1 4-hydroxy-3-methylbut-2-enyl diphosphate reductase [Bacteroidales bacterium]
MEVEIDSNSGFCFGVVNAIQLAEMELEKTDLLYCLGDIVHNNAEVERLKGKGLTTINHEEFKNLKNCKVLLRAHGEPPETYKIALENNIQLIDASCPVVLKLQKNIKLGFDAILEKGGQVVIYGKEGHAEVNGLVGQTNGKAIVIGGIDDLEKIDFSKPINIFSQTTKSIEGFYAIEKEIRNRMIDSQRKDNVQLISNDTICRQVSHRQPQLREFVKRHDVVVFVSGKKSSNGKMLFQVCKDENPNTYFVSDENELEKAWFEKATSVGICGATSTPRWLMEKIAESVKK